jgi:hypothetical protein
MPSLNHHSSFTECSHYEQLQAKDFQMSPLLTLPTPHSGSWHNHTDLRLEGEQLSPCPKDTASVIRLQAQVQSLKPSHFPHRGRGKLLSFSYSCFCFAQNKWVMLVQSVNKQKNTDILHMVEDNFQAPQWMPENIRSTKPCSVFPTYLPMVKVNL